MNVRCNAQSCFIGTWLHDFQNLSLSRVVNPHADKARLQKVIGFLFQLCQVDEIVLSQVFGKGSGFGQGEIEH